MNRGLAAQILGASTLSIALRVAGLLLSYAAHIVLSRSLGLHGYGQYVVALGWVMVLTLPARLGFDYSALRYVTVYLDRGDKSGLHGFLRVSLWAVAIASFVVGAAMFLVGTAAGRSIDRPSLLAAATLVLPLALLGVLSVAMRIAKRIFASQFYDQVLRPGLLLVLLVGWALLDRERTPASAMMLTTLAALVALVALAVHFRRTFAESWAARPSYAEWRGWFALSIPLLGIALSQEALNQLEIILLGSLSDARAAGLFAAASRLTSLTAFALAAFGIISGPMIASAYHRSDFGELHQITKLTTRLALGFSALVGIVFMIGGRFLLGLFGPEFTAAYPALLILLLGGLVNASTGVVAYLMTLTGRERPALAIFVAALGLSLVLNLLLIPRLGVVGAAIASTCALSFWNVAMVFYVRRSIGIDASALGLSPRPARLPKRA